VLEVDGAGEGEEELADEGEPEDLGDIDAVEIPIENAEIETETEVEEAQGEGRRL